MAVRIKTISNDIQGAESAPTNKHPVHHASQTSGEYRQTSMILELEWEALGKKLNKHIDGTSNAEVDRLRRQLKEKDEKLRQAEQRIAELKKQLFALQEKQRMHKGPIPGTASHDRPHRPGGQAPGNGPQQRKSGRPPFQGHQRKPQDQGPK